MVESGGRPDEPERSVIPAAVRAKPKRTAVLIVHGMGSQRPLDTLRGVVKAVWTNEPVLGGDARQFWLHYDRIVGDVDLPVATTSAVDDSGRQIVFHEFYWAHLMAETRLMAVMLWLFEFVRKGPPRTSRVLRGPWWIAVPFLIAVIFSAILLVLEGGFRLLAIPVGDWAIALPWLLTLIVVLAAMRWRGVAIATAMFAVDCGAAFLFHGGAPVGDAVLGQLHDPKSLLVAAGLLVLFAGLAVFFLTSVFGDAARYYRNSPANIRVRREIRTLGASILDGLHTNEFDRIVVVAHSLGSVIAYDVLRAYWANVASSFGDVASVPGVEEQDRFPPSVQPGELPRDMNDEQRRLWRDRGRRIQRELARRRGSKKPLWLVSDFVTLGSPLTHARYLNATGESHDDLDLYFSQRLADREIPTCPALYNGTDGRLTYTRTGTGFEGMKFLHHAALFGLTRWTNLYFPGRVLNGDFIGGPLRPVVGSGVEDVPLKPTGIALSWHTRYWTWKEGEEAPGYIAVVRDAINLAERGN